ncbi:hypothetical protein AJ78_01030 [Emergomyces pasteurianus Ep9510]|uniref:Uncharacterized protein n=1 Tax=Emergomyces pasteurianus Ep9510 TaxID=1447872 RepID=A0A1J9PRF9_9EURO|nr:hypothetical protein AJ78_01030 [Emergomyces pasteurianus Ep9510]
MAVMELTGFSPFRPDAILQSRDIRTTFSSWDSCMAKSYCKWPVIVGIVVGGIILLGAVWGIIACACCGYTCCKGCCACCSCCCPSSRKKSHDRTKYADEHSTYDSQNRHLSAGYQRPPAPPVYDSHHSNPTKFAQFDTAHPRTKANDDALPQMPTWDSATTRRVEDTSESYDVEMNRLDPTTGQSFKTHSFSRPVRVNNMHSNANGGKNYYDGGATSPGYPPSFDSYRGAENTSHIARSPSPGNHFAHTDAIGVATSHPTDHHQHHQQQQQQQLQQRSLSPSPVSPYPPYTEVPTTTTSIMPNAITTHTTMSPPPINPVEPPRRYPPTPIPHSPSPPTTRSYSPYPPPQPIPQLQHLRHSPTQSPTQQSPRRHQQQQGGPAYMAYSPSVPNTPPPPFSSTLGDYDQVLPGAQHGQYGTGTPQQEQGPPSVLQAGRTPGGANHSWREV